MSTARASDQLKEAFENAEEHRVRLIKVVQKKMMEGLVETLDVAETVESPTGSTLEKDFESISGLLNDEEPCFVLVRLDKSSPVRRAGRLAPLWTIILWNPGQKARAQIVLSGALENLQMDLGLRYFDEVIQASELADVKWSSYMERHAPGPKAFSKGELTLERAYAMEAQARQEMQELRQSSVRGIGGYHSIEIPLSAGAQDALKQLFRKDVNWVQLSISPDGQTITCDEAAMLDIDDLPSHVHPSEPRFYFYAFGGRSVGAYGTSLSKLFFIYSAPDSAPVKLRMPYSTAKPGVAEAAKALGVEAFKSVEIQEGSELTADFFRDRSQREPVKSKWGGGPVADRGKLIQPKKTSEAPAYAAWASAAPGGQGSSSRKKIVIPPRGAYM